LDVIYYDVTTGEILNADELACFLPVKKESKKQAAIGLIGEQQIKWIKPMVDSIVSLVGLATKGVIFKRRDYDRTKRLGLGC